MQSKIADIEALRIHSTQSAGDPSSLLHQLQVHQVELEVQNEELRRVQAELQLAHDLFFDLYELAPVGYCTLNKKGKIQRINLTACQLLGMNRSVILGTYIFRRLFDEDHQYFHQLLQKQEADVPQNWLLRLRKADGLPHWLHWVSRTELDVNGEWVWKLVLTDATELHQAQEAQRRLTSELNTQVQSLKLLTKELTQSEELERHALAEDLHDNFAQWLAAIKINLATVVNLEGTALVESVGKMDTLLGQADDALRSLIYELSPPSITALGLGAAWGHLIKLLKNSYDLVVVLNDQTAPKLLDEVRSIVVYRCVRELLVNVAKHSGVKRAELSCVVTNGQMVVAVSDDGCGFDPLRVSQSRQATGRFGLQGLQRRLSAIQGSVEIDSAMDKGCLVVLSVPIRSDAPQKVFP